MDSPVQPSLSLHLTPHVPQQRRDDGAVQGWSDGQMVRWSPPVCQLSSSGFLSWLGACVREEERCRHELSVIVTPT